MVASGLCAAQELGRVVSSTPVMQQVGVPRQVCTTEQVVVQQPRSGAGALMGAIAGGAVGNAIGNGSGRAAATMLGIMGGAIVGDRVEGAPPAQLQNVQRCGMQTFFESRVVAYNVVYDYAGRHHSVQMANDPGPTLQLQINPVGASAPVVAAPNYAQPVYGQAAPTVVMTPAVPYGYYGRPYYPPLAVELDFGRGYGESRHGRHHGH